MTVTSNAGLFLLFENAKSNLSSITIDIDSGVINVEGQQEGAAKGYNPKKLGNRCYNIQFAFCDELKSYVTGFVRSGNTYTANGTAEIIKAIESLGCKYLIKAKTYTTLVSQLTNSSAKIIKTARSVIMKLSEKYPYRGVYEKCLRSF